MTLAELGSRMSNAEFELRLAHEIMKAEECPSCGQWQGDLGKIELVPVKCPFCEHKYSRVRSRSPDGTDRRVR